MRQPKSQKKNRTSGDTRTRSIRRCHLKSGRAGLAVTEGTLRCGGGSHHTSPLQVARAVLEHARSMPTNYPEHNDSPPKSSVPLGDN